MLFHSSLRKELARSFGATLVVLVTIVMTMMLIKALGQASRGSVDPSDVMLVMGFTVLGYLPTILTLSLFIAIVATLSRLYADSEMVIWFSAGRGLTAFLPPLFRFAWPILLTIGVLALVAWPWANQQTRQLRDSFERRGDIDRIAPGQFQESAGGQRVFFIDKDAPDDKSASNVFIATNERGRETVTSARSGRLETTKGDRFLVLNNGQRVVNSTGQSALEISEFAEYGTLVGRDVLAMQASELPRVQSTPALMRNPTLPNQGELAWRLGLVMGAVNLVVIALAVAHASPRAGPGGSLAFALFAFIAYYNLINVGQSWVGSGRASLPFALIVLHGLALAVGAAWLAMRHNNRTLRTLWRRRTTAQEAA